MRRVPAKALSDVAKATVSRVRHMATTTPPPKVTDHQEREEEDTDELAMPKLEELEFIPFPRHIPGGMVVMKNTNKTAKNSGHKSSSDQDKVQGTNGGGKPDYIGGCSGCLGCGDEKGTGGGGGSGCSGCPGCTRCGCPGCSGGCDLCFGCDACKYYN